MFEFYYKQEIKKYNYWIFPSFFMNEEPYKNLSNDAKLLYFLMRNRLKDCIKKNYFDKRNRAFIIFYQTDICKVLNIANQKASKIVKELENVNLIEIKRNKINGPNIYFIKKYEIL